MSFPATVILHLVSFFGRGAFGVAHGLLCSRGEEAFRPNEQTFDFSTRKLGIQTLPDFGVGQRALRANLPPVYYDSVSPVEALLPEHGIGTKIVRNTVSGALRIVVLAPIPFLLTPFLLRHVGTTDLGFGPFSCLLTA